MKSRLAGFSFLLAIIWLPLYRGALPVWSLSIAAFFFALFLLTAAGSGDVRLPLWPWILTASILFLLSAWSSKIPSASLLETFKFSAAVTAFWAAVNHCDGRENLKKTVFVLACLGGALSVMGLVQYLGGLPNFWWHDRRFLASVYVNHNHFAGFLEMVLPVSLGLALAERDGAKKALLFFMCLVMAAGFVFTMSRGGYAALLWGLVVFAAVIAKAKALDRRVVWCAVTGVVLLTVGLVFFDTVAVAERVATIGGFSGDKSFASRLVMWKAALGIVRDHPWLGSGPGTFEHVFLLYRPDGFPSRPVFAHNDYLQTASDCGLLFSGAALVLWALFFVKGLKIVRRDDSRLRIYVGAGCLAGAAALAVHSAVDFNFHIPANLLIFAVVAGILFAMENAAKKTGTAKKRRTAAASLSLTVAVAALFLGSSDAIGANPLNARAFYDRARSMRTPAAAKGDLERAIGLNAYEPYFHYELGKRELESGDLKKALLSYSAALKKDPKEARLHYLVGRDLLKATRTWPEPPLKKNAFSALRRSIELDAKYARFVYPVLWDRYQSLTPLKDFDPTPGGRGSFLNYLETHDQWKEHRPYFLESSGVDPKRKYALLGAGEWGAGASYPVEGFRSRERKPNSGGYFYRRGEADLEIRLEAPLSRLLIRARGSKAGRSYPYAVIKLDGRVIDALYIDSPRPANFYTALEAQPGMHTLTVEYRNDYSGGKPRQDRNFWIETIEIRPLKGRS